LESFGGFFYQQLETGTRWAGELRDFFTFISTLPFEEGQKGEENGFSQKTNSQRCTKCGFGH
jgi:hypothetical protein